MSFFLTLQYMGPIELCICGANSVAAVISCGNAGSIFSGAGSNVLTERGYDRRGRLVTTTDHNLGLVSTRTNPKAVDRTFAYDPLDRVVRETVDPLRRSITLDGLGRGVELRTSALDRDAGGG